jgi:hypothetical protein
MHHVRAVLLMRYVPAMSKEFAEEFGEETYTTLLDMAKNPQAGITSDTLRTLLTAYTQMAYATLPYVPLELALIDLTTPLQGESLDKKV